MPVGFAIAGFSQVLHDCCSGALTLRPMVFMEKGHLQSWPCITGQSEGELRQRVNSSLLLKKKNQPTFIIVFQNVKKIEIFTQCTK